MARGRYTLSGHIPHAAAVPPARPRHPPAMPNEAIDLLIKRELPAAVQGDRDAYGRIVIASQNAVTAVALAITRDVPTSEDIAQEAFLSAWHHLPRLK